MKDTINELYPEVTDLSSMHEVISPEQARKACDYVQKSFLTIFYQQQFEKFAKEI